MILEIQEMRKKMYGLEDENQSGGKRKEEFLKYLKWKVRKEAGIARKMELRRDFGRFFLTSYSLIKFMEYGGRGLD